MNNRCFMQHESGIAESRALLSSVFRATMQDHFPFVAFVEKTVAAYGLGRLQNKKTVDYLVHRRSYRRVRLSIVRAMRRLVKGRRTPLYSLKTTSSMR